MSVTAENILSHEIIGLAVNIAESTDPTLCGTGGVVTFETKNMISIRDSSSRILKVAKKAATKIQVQTDAGVCFISGSSLIGRPEDRISRLS
ncbi:MAG TPA: ribonuclease P protein subunit [Nitrososphaera sp.]|jgi:ribonuclease P protein subunit POP4